MTLRHNHSYRTRPWEETLSLNRRLLRLLPRAMEATQDLDRKAHRRVPRMYTYTYHLDSLVAVAAWAAALAAALADHLALKDLTLGLARLRAYRYLDLVGFRQRQVGSNPTLLCTQVASTLVVLALALMTS